MSGLGAEQIRALVSGYGPSERGRHLMAILQAFVDDSGNSDGNGNPVFVLAGYISSADKWTAFSDEWEAECDQAPPIRKFKMAQANAFRGDFDGWTREDRDERLLKLAAVVQRHTVLRIQTSMAWEDYNDILRGNMPGVAESPYIWLMWRLIVDLADWQEARGLNQKVDFIFDDQGSIGTQAVALFESLRAVLPPEHTARMGDVMHRHDDKVLPLKAADMWAWHIRRYLATGITAIQAGQPVPPQSELWKALAHCEAVGEMFDSREVAQLLVNYTKGVRDASLGIKPFWEEP